MVAKIETNILSLIFCPIAAIKTNRHYVGYEIEKEYVRLAESLIKDFTELYWSGKLFKLENK